jgi:hypothetical protein
MASYAKYLLGYAAYKIRLTNRKKSCQIIWFMFVWFMLCDKMTLKMHQALHQIIESDDEMSILVMKCPKNGLSVNGNQTIGRALCAVLGMHTYICSRKIQALAYFIPACSLLIKKIWHYRQVSLAFPTLANQPFLTQ